MIALKQVTKDLLKFYKPLTLDWLNYKVTRQNTITFHHIVKQEHGGLYTLDNGALLTERGHRYLHIIEYKECQIYEALNKMFLIINKQRSTPTIEQREIINYLLDEFYNLHKNDRTKKGKRLIKYDFLDREHT